MKLETEDLYYERDDFVDRLTTAVRIDLRALLEKIEALEAQVQSLEAEQVEDKP